jgi:endonuclease III
MISKILKKTPEEIVTDICNAYNNSLGVFIEKTNAEDLVPNIDKDQQVQFLFWVIQMDYATKSSKLYENSNRLYKENTFWLSPDYFLNMTDEILLVFIKTNFRPRYANEIVKRFKINAKKLNEEYSGSAINIVHSANSAVELLSKVKEFRGFGDKLANFLVRTYIDLLQLTYSDIDQVLPPVDVHDVRLTYEWGFIENKDMTEKNIKYVKKLWSNACKNTNSSWIIFDKALWLIGSKGSRIENTLNDYLSNIGAK